MIFYAPLKRSVTLFPWLILLRKSLKLAEPWHREAVIEHEKKHAEQQRRPYPFIGWFVFMARYLFSGHWRAKYEAEAFAINVQAFVEHGYVYESMVAHYASIIRTRYYPPYWFGRAPLESKIKGWIYSWQTK